MSIDVTSGSADVIYVFDIFFESKANKGRDWRAVIQIHSDSDGDGVAEENDEVAPGATITVEFAGQTYSGVTDSDGVFRTSWIKDLGSGDHYAEALDLVLANYFWDSLTLDLEDDSDLDGYPDEVLSL